VKIEKTAQIVNKAVPAPTRAHNALFRQAFHELPSSEKYIPMRPLTSPYSFFIASIMTYSSLVSVTST
jgi:hypothetical protein